MKIQAINTNTNFKGLFTDKSAQHGGNWFMEYRPYSWECNNTGKMANKVRVDEYASTLPDNEEIFTRGIAYEESSKDILGTESYFKSANGIMRRTITEAPSMNREESLGVLDKKLDVFLRIKKGIRETLENSFGLFAQNIENNSSRYNHYSSEYDSIFLFGKDDMKIEMDNSKLSLMQKFHDMYANLVKYKKLMGSIIDVNARQQEIKEEIKQIQKLKKTGNLIDISRRDVENPNEPLIQALKNRVAAATKVICMPDGLISMDSILSKAGKDVSTEEIIKFVERKIKRISV